MNSIITDLTKSTTNWSRSIKFKRSIWSLIIEPLVRWLPRFCSPLRIWALRVMGAVITDPCYILPGVKILMPWNLKLSAYAVLGFNVNIYNFAPVSIGCMSVISQNSFLCTGSHDYTHPHMPLIWKPITIGSECWVAAEAFIGPGVEIGNGAVIGARSVVTRNMPEWMVCAGNPCQPIKVRSIQTL